MCGANPAGTASLLHPPPILSYPCTIHSTTRGVILADLRVHVIFSTFTCARTYMARSCRHGISLQAEMAIEKQPTERDCALDLKVVG